MKIVGAMGTRGWFRIHSFTGVFTGLLLFVVCWSGTFAVLSNEIDWLVTPEARADANEGTTSWGQWLAALQQAFPDAEVQRLEAPLHPSSAAVAVVDLPNQVLVRVYLQPGTGEILSHGSYFTVQRFFRNLHSYLFLPGIGSYIVSILSLTLLVSLLSSLMFYKRWWVRLFRFRPGSGCALWSELHKSSGLWSLWFIAVIALTGAWYLFEMTRSDWLDGKFSYAGTGASVVHQIPAPESSADQPEVSLDRLIERVGEVRPDLRIRMVHLANSREGAIYMDGQTDHVLVRDRANQLHLDRRSGAILYDQNASDYPLYWRWSDTADPLHFGNFGGLWSKVVWFLFGLVLSGLILTGTYLHVQRLAREAGGRSRHRWPGTGAAIVVTLLVLAASVSFGFDEARYFGPVVDGVRQVPDLAPGAKGVIIGWVGLTLAIIAGWIWMLWKAPAGRPSRTPKFMFDSAPRADGRRR